MPSVYLQVRSEKGQKMSFRTLVSIVLVAPSVSLAGTVAGKIDTHQFDLEVTCEFNQAMGWIQIRSDSGFSQKDTNGDGFFLEVSGPGSPLGVVFKAKDEVYKFGFSDVEVSETGFASSETMRRSDGSEYDVALDAKC